MKSNVFKAPNKYCGPWAGPSRNSEQPSNILMPVMSSVLLKVNAFWLLMQYAVPHQERTSIYGTCGYQVLESNIGWNMTEECIYKWRQSSHLDVYNPVLWRLG
jgi:hypothetical protein